MLLLSITVYAELRQEKFVRALKSVFEPDNVLLEFSDRTDGSVTEFPLDRAHMVITDSYDRIEQLRGMSCHNLRYIFVGTMKLSDDLEDVWDTDSPAEITARFERVLQHSSYQAAAWFFEHTLYNTIDTVSGPVWFKRADGIHTMVNRAFADTVGKKREDIIGRGEYPALCTRADEETAISTGQARTGEGTLMTADGKKRFATCIAPLFDMFGNAYGTVGCAHEIKDKE